MWIATIRNKINGAQVIVPQENLDLFPLIIQALLDIYGHDEYKKMFHVTYVRKGECKC